MAEEYDGETTFSPTSSSNMILSTPTEQLLNADSGHQAPKNAAQSL